MPSIPWSVLIPLLIIIAILYFLVRSKRKQRESRRGR